MTASASRPTPPIRRTSAPSAREHRGDARRAAEPVLAVVGPEQGDRRLLADPLGVAPDVAVEDQVADDEDAGVSRASRRGGSSRRPCARSSLTVDRPTSRPGIRALRASRDGCIGRKAYRPGPRSSRPVAAPIGRGPENRGAIPGRSGVS